MLRSYLLTLIINAVTMINLKKVVYNIHLILGLISGVIVFIVSITGSIYVFRNEMESLLQPYREVPAKEESFQAPSELISEARQIFPGRKFQSIVYGRPDDAAEVLFYEHEPLFYRGILLNPYTGDVMKVKNYKKDFFHFIFQGHFQLWLPLHIGKPVVAIAVLVFVMMLITGIVLWWPRKEAARLHFRIHWKAPWKRRIFDLHSVLGFYLHIVLLVIALTGLVWGFQWFSEALYSATGGEKNPSFIVPASDSTKHAAQDSVHPFNIVYRKMHRQYPGAATIEIFNAPKNLAIYARANPDDQTHWQTDYRYFDRNTLKEIEINTVWGKLEDATVPDKIRRLNYDIHSGAIGGLPGKILAFFAGLVAASLPVTGFLMWWRKRKEKQKLKSGLDL